MLNFNLNFKAMTQTFYKEQVDVVEELIDIKSLIVHNDDVNTFDWVIEALMDICDHTLEQAEQCSILIHYKGRASVKNGSLNELKPLKQALLDRTISVTIE
jgi:ATP-dependent Clp protease adaptor protein ClpS